jgi:hypothetical protein
MYIFRSALGNQIQFEVDKESDSGGTGEQVLGFNPEFKGY